MRGVQFWEKAKKHFRRSEVKQSWNKYITYKIHAEERDYAEKNKLGTISELTGWTRYRVDKETEEYS